jgi:MerR family mercuric resistance operon transcriptional regulator
VFDLSPTKNAAYTIGALARAAGVHVETIRYYQRRGLLRQPSKPGGQGFRRYGEGDLRRLRLIKSAQQLGFSLTEIADLVIHVDNGNCPATKQLAQRKVTEVRNQLETLEKVLQILKELVGECAGPCPTPCPLMRRFRDHEFEFFADSPRDG